MFFLNSVIYIYAVSLPQGGELVHDLYNISRVKWLYFT